MTRVELTLQFDPEDLHQMESMVLELRANLSPEQWAGVSELSEAVYRLNHPEAPVLLRAPRVIPV